MYLTHIPISVIMHTKISWEIGNIVVINLICHYRFYIVYQLLLKQWYQKVIFFFHLFLIRTLPNLFFIIQTEPYFYIKVDETAVHENSFDVNVTQKQYTAPILQLHLRYI